MMTIKLNKYGSILTGRDFAIKVMSELSNKISPPVSLDFEGISAIGSSLGDEVVAPIAKRQNNQITVYNANIVVQDCLKEIAKDFNIEITYK